MRTATVSAPARLRAKSQVTIPETIVEAAGVTEGDRFVVIVEPDDPDTIRLHRVRDTYAGALRDVFGDVDTYLNQERAGWDRDG